MFHDLLARLHVFSAHICFAPAGLSFAAPILYSLIHVYALALMCLPTHVNMIDEVYTNTLQLVLFWGLQQSEYSLLTYWKIENKRKSLKQLQPYFNCSNPVGTMKKCSRQG